jgi:hypothetical protein
MISTSVSKRIETTLSSISDDLNPSRPVVVLKELPDTALCVGFVTDKKLEKSPGPHLRRDVLGSRRNTVLDALKMDGGRRGQLVLLIESLHGCSSFVGSRRVFGGYCGLWGTRPRNRSVEDSLMDQPSTLDQPP